jgi:adenylate kinase
MRKHPNIIVTGTPGVGKTSHCEVLSQKTGLRHLSVNDVVKDKECHEGWDDELSCWIVDEDKVRLTPQLTI